MADSKPSPVTQLVNIPPEWEAVERVAQELDDYCDKLATARAAPPFEPAPESPNAQDIELWRDLALNLSADARDLQLVALDNARAVVKTFRRPPNVLAGYSCGRVVLEHCSIASWLVDNHSANWKDRFKRYLHTNLIEMEKLLKRHQQDPTLDSDLGIDFNGHKETFHNHVTTVEQEMKKLGIAPYKIEPTFNRPMYCVVPSSTKLASLYFDAGDRDYQKYSATTHGESWTRNAYWLVKIDNDCQSTLLFRPRLAIGLMMKVALWLKGSADRIYTYHGWCRTDIDEASQCFLERLTSFGHVVTDGPSVVATS